MTRLSAWVNEMALVPYEPASMHTNPFPPLPWHNSDHTKTLPEKNWGDAGGEPTRCWWPLITCPQGSESECFFRAAQKGSGWCTFKELGREGWQGGDYTFVCQSVVPSHCSESECGEFNAPRGAILLWLTF